MSFYACDRLIFVDVCIFYAFYLENKNIMFTFVA